MHLLDQFLVVEGAQIEFFVGHGKRTPEQPGMAHLSPNPRAEVEIYLFRSDLNRADCDFHIG
jgi:hypothetical protein